jgi:hypothetical protein
MYSLILPLVIILVIVILFNFVNIILKKNIENYGEYCGRYNMDRGDGGHRGKRYCMENETCKWTTYVDKSTKIKNEWCTGKDPTYKDKKDTTILDAIKIVTKPFTLDYSS